MFSQGIAEGINIHAKGIDTVFDDIDSFFDFMRCILSISGYEITHPSSLAVLLLRVNSSMEYTENMA